MDQSETTPYISKRLRRLIEAEGLKRFALCLVAGEGKELPNGEEDASGYVVNEDGRVFSFWIGWDEAAGTETFDIWTEEQPGPDWFEHEEFREARAAVGLTNP